MNRNWFADLRNRKSRLKQLWCSVSDKRSQLLWTTLAFLTFSVTAGKLAAQDCPSGYNYKQVSKSCVGPPISNNSCLPGYVLVGPSGSRLCSGPPFDCPGQPGYQRIFRKGGTTDTTCTDADMLDYGGSCPAGYYHTSAARRPYQDLCVAESRQVPASTPKDARIAFAEHAQKESNQLDPKAREVITATGPSKATFLIAKPSVNDRYLTDLFRSGTAYEKDLWRRGFRLTVVTDGSRRKWLRNDPGSLQSRTQSTGSK